VSATATLLETQRLCVDGFQPFPLYSSRIPLPYALPPVHDASSLVVGGYSVPYPTVTPTAVGVNHVTTGSDVTATLRSTPLTTPCRGVAPTIARCSLDDARRLTEARSGAATTPAITLNGATTPPPAPRHLADSGIASRRRRVAAAQDARRRLQSRRRSFLFTAGRRDTGDDSSSTASYEHVATPPPVDVDAAATGRCHSDVDAVELVADSSSSLPTSDSAYSDADEVPDDVAER